MKIRSRKTLSLILAAATAVTSMTACSSSQTGTNQGGSSQAENSQTGTSQAGAGQPGGSAAAGGNSDLAGGSGNSLEGTTITFWHSMGGVNGEAIDYLVDKFNKGKYPGNYRGFPVPGQL